MVDQARVPQHAGSVADRDLALEPRLPAPLPLAVWWVARANLILFGVLCVAGGLFVVGSGLAVVIFPLALGRDGVGRAMITLFLCCATVVATGLAFLAARSAAQVIRRERHGVGSLLAFVRVGALVSVVAAGITWWLSVAFFADVDQWALPVSVPALLAIAVCVLAFGHFAWGMRVLSKYRRSLAGAAIRLG